MLRKKKGGWNDEVTGVVPGLSSAREVLGGDEEQIKRTLR